MQSDPFYKTKERKRKRLVILRREKYKCQILKRYGRTAEATTVHHIYPLEDYPQYALCNWNLIAVSQEGNNMLHDRKTEKLTALGLWLMERTEIPGAPHP